MELLVLSPDDCYPLRSQLLRRKPTLEGAGFAQDLDEGALHLGFKQGKVLLGVVSILPDRRNGVDEMWRMAGLVVTPEQRGEGLGRKLATAAQTVVAERGGGLWAEIPKTAAGFLEACGMTPAPAGKPRSKAATAKTPQAVPSKVPRNSVHLVWAG